MEEVKNSPEEEKKITPEEVKSKLPFNGNKKFIWIIVAILILGGAYFYGKKPNSPLTKLFQKGITQDEAKAKVKELIDNSGGGAEVTGVTMENGLYKVTVNSNKQDFPVYVTKDGKKFFPQGPVDFDEAKKQAEAAKQKEADTYKPVEKSDKPVVDLYVMGFCPYGNKSEDTLKPVYSLLKDKVTFNFHYIVDVTDNKVQSLHGDKEVTEDEREACILRDYGKDKWMDFVTYVNDKCGSDGSCWEDAAKSGSINTAKVTACVTSSGVTLMKAEADASKKTGASGSPTMIINGSQTKAVYQYGNSDAYKTEICNAFNNPPSECSQKLGSSTDASAQGGSCGN
jgi:hypothetical protein